MLVARAADAPVGRRQNNDLNPQAWAVVLGDAATRDVQIARPVYEAFLKRFPTAVRWPARRTLPPVRAR